METSKSYCEPHNLKKERIDIVDDYMEQLELSPEDLRKRILDIGSGLSNFAKKASENSLGSQIFSLDLRIPAKGAPKATIGTAEALPFRNGEFDIVISNAAFPFFVLMDKQAAGNLEIGDSSMAQQKIEIVLRELLRVLKQNGEIKLGRVSRNNSLPVQRMLEPVFDEVVKEFQKNGTITAEYIPKGELMDYRNPNRKIADMFLVKIRKI